MLLVRSDIEYRIAMFDLLPRKTESQCERGWCVACNAHPQASKGAGVYRSICQKCHDLRTPANNNRGRRFKYRIYKKDRCEECGFVPVHHVQLDVDHIDGNHQNNDPDNLMTLCANCHRLKTHESGDHLGEAYAVAAAAA